MLSSNLYGLFSYVALPYEELRIAYAFIYLSLFVYYDLKNNKNIPDKLVYILSGIALLFPLTFPPAFMAYAYVQAILLFALLYVSYMMGQLGLAEVFAFSSLAALFPNPPAISGVPINLPFVFFIFVYSGILFALFALIFFIVKLKNKPKLNAMHMLLLAFFIILLAVAFILNLASSSFLFLLTIVFFASFYFTVSKNEILRWFVKKVKVDEAEEEVFAYPFATEKEKELLGDVKVLKKAHLNLLKKNKIEEVTVYGNMFPFTPFLLLGFILSLFFSQQLILL